MSEGEGIGCGLIVAVIVFVLGVWAGYSSDSKQPRYHEVMYAIQKTYCVRSVSTDESSQWKTVRLVLVSEKDEKDVVKVVADQQAQNFSYYSALKVGDKVKFVPTKEEIDDDHLTINGREFKYLVPQTNPSPP